MKKYFKIKELKTLKLIIIFLIIGGFLLAGGMYIKSMKDNGPIFDDNSPTAVFSKIVKNILLSSEEKTFLVIFQNNMELRPSGGFIGSFGIVKVKDAEITEFSVHDTANFDGRIPDTVKPPYPMEEMLHIDSWKLRDANYSPDFMISAKKAEEFYYAGSGEEIFDGIIGINASVLETVLKNIGPVSVDGIGEFNEENVLIALEKQVEIDYKEQGIGKGDRKKVVKSLFNAILDKIEEKSLKEKLGLAKSFISEMKQKEIQFYFKDMELQESAEAVGWAGRVNQEWKNDYLMMVVANLGGYKSDYYVKRDIDYSVDLSKNRPIVNVKITHHHTAKEKNWMVNDYQGYLRIYVPEGAWLADEDLADTVIENDLGKKVFGRKIFVPVGKSGVTEFQYYLPESYALEDYNLLFQKQSGVERISFSATIKYPDGSEKGIEKSIKEDYILIEE